MMTRSRPLASSLRAASGLGAGLAVAACIIHQEPAPGGPQPPPPAYAGDEQPSDDYAGEPAPTGSALVDGDYSCSIEPYPAYTCVVYTAEDGSQVLEKVFGSQRLRGRITSGEGGFSFDGEFFCPYGGCTEQVDADFEVVDAAAGSYRGTLPVKHGPIVLSMTYAPGGLTYGGVPGAGSREAAPESSAPPAPSPPPAGGW